MNKIPITATHGSVVEGQTNFWTHVVDGKASAVLSSAIHAVAGKLK